MLITGLSIMIEKKFNSWVLPGVLDVCASFDLLVKAFNNVDFPTFDPAPWIIIARDIASPFKSHSQICDVVFKRPVVLCKRYKPDLVRTTPKMAAGQIYCV